MEIKYTIEILTKACQEAPTSSVAAFFLGMAYKQVMDYEKALGQFQDAVTLTPKIKEALVELIDVALHLGTLAAVAFAFWRDWVRLIAAGLRGIVSGRPLADPDSRLLWYLALATIPGALAGLALTHQLLQQPDEAARAMDLLLEFALELNQAQSLSAAHSCQARLHLLPGLKLGPRAQPLERPPVRPFVGRDNASHRRGD